MAKKKFIIVSWGGIGDAIVSIPALKAFRLKNPDYKIILYYPNMGHKDIFLNSPYIDSMKPLKLRSVLLHPTHLFAFITWRYPNSLLAKTVKRWATEYVLLWFQHIPLTWAYQKHVIDIVPEIFDLKLSDRSIEFFLTEKEENAAIERLRQYKDTVFMHIHSKSSPNHHWSMEKWEQLIKELPQFTFIQYGSLNEPQIKGALDWRGKTTLREALCLLKHSSTFVGVDSSFSHATSGFKVPGVVLWGDSSPLYWGHDNNINIYKKTECSPCYYDLWGSSCPYGNICMNLISVEEVKEALIKQVNSRYSEKQPETAIATAF
jgi:ADP-heptose:LPS heptosyltransferase